jgi:hypothetical protein
VYEALLDVDLPAIVDLHGNNECGDHVNKEEEDVEPKGGRVELCVCVYECE